MTETTLRYEFFDRSMPNGSSRVRWMPEPSLHRRKRLLDLDTGLVEDLQCGAHERTAEDFCDVFQVCLPYRGFGIWHVEGSDVAADTNQVLFVRGGEPYRLSGPVRGGYAELIITPEVEILSEILGVDGKQLFEHRLFRQRHTLADPAVQALRTQFLHLCASGGVQQLAAEEHVVALLQATLRQQVKGTRTSSASTERLVRRTKQYLEEHLPHPMRLQDVARAVGASPAYLTHIFSKVEGRSLHQYVTQIRLARALAELPRADDLTAVALDNGFSSHSHFTATFRRTFGYTPSQFRERTRQRQDQ